MNTTTTWPPDTPDGTLTLAALLRAERELQRPAWWWTIRHARVVEVRATPYVDRGQVFALDVEKAGHLWRRDRDLGRVLVLCNGDEREQVHDLVDRIRLGC